MKKFLRNDKGFTTVDIGIAMIAITIFAVILTSISYNTYLSSIEAKRTAVAVNYAVDIFENIEELEYERVSIEYDDIFDVDALSEFVEDSTTTSNGAQIITGHIGTYNIELKIEDYNEENLIKIISLRIEFLVSKGHTEKVELQRLKVNR